MSQKIYISVIIPLKIEWTPCYFWRQPACSTPADGDAGPDPSPKTCIETGDRVRVMFAGKEYTGVVNATGITPETDPEKIQEILSVEYRLGKISVEEMELWRQIADYYLCTIGEVFKAAYPAHKLSSEKSHARREALMEKKIKDTLAKLDAKKESLDARYGKKLKALQASRKEITRARYENELSALKSEISRISLRIEEIRSGDPKSGNPYSITDDVRALSPGITLSAAQEKALASLKGTFSERRTALLKGVTGSGKTEIYITLAAETLRQGKNVLYLVPEIALSKQLEERLNRIFGDRLLVFHSGESLSERQAVASAVRSSGHEAGHTGNGASVETDNHMSLQTGNYIVLGTRSSVFLPHRDLGLIIIDEEHDNSYKQDNPSPRYNGRDTAVMLGSIHKSNVLLGSATPSLESLYNCRTGKYRMTELSEKYYGDTEPEIELIDTISERKKKGMRGSLSLKLIFRIEEVLKKGEQAIILRSRRSYSPSLQCTECGFIPKCPHCNISLSYHKASEKDICHYCGYSRRHMGTCQKCGGQIEGLGAGTQKIEEELSALFPTARIARLDSDSAQDRKKEEEIIRGFGSGEVDILVGTQMVTKGFDFSGLSLVAVIGSDSLLAMQDFRADEKASQILEQFCGRCGRRGQKGSFVIQTCQKDHPVYQQLLHKTDVPASDRLLEERKEFGYPPYCRIIDICIKDSFEERLSRMAGRLAGSIGDLRLKAMGPYTPPIGKAAGHHVRMIRVSIDKDRFLQANKSALRKCISGFEKREKYTGHISIDVDPA